MIRTVATRKTAEPAMITNADFFTFSHFTKGSYVFTRPGPHGNQENVRAFGPEVNKVGVSMLPYSERGRYFF